MLPPDVDVGGLVTYKINVVFDCADPERLAQFWMLALPGYTFPTDPPDGFATWDEWADAQQIPQEQRNTARTIVDHARPDRPDIFFLKVPESKLAKNRVHLDVKVGGALSGAKRRQLIEQTAARLTEAGAAIHRRVDGLEGFWLVLQDPEGNEFCLI